MTRGYLIRQGEVHDGSGAAPRTADVRVRDGRIAEMGPRLPPDGDEVVDAAGLLVVPGLIDLHVHVYSGMGYYPIDPEQSGLRSGVTTLVDAGTAGAWTYPTFHRHVIPQAREDVFAFLHISLMGLHGHAERFPYGADLHDDRLIDPDLAAATIEQHRDRLLGVKVRLTSKVADGRMRSERLALEGALAAARRTRVPVMVHHAMSGLSLAEVLEALRPGDIYTHLYNPYEGGPFEAGLPETLVQARRRGVLFDVGHGAGAFAWDVAERACRKFGFWPDTISTDLHRFNVRGPVYDLPTTLSKFLHLGMPLSDVIRAATSNPARAAGLEDRFGRILPGRQADLTLLRLEKGRFELVDVRGQARHADRRLMAVRVFKRGES